VTFSIVARCAETGMFGVAVSSSSPAVAARCAHARARVGAAASQNITDPALGPAMLDRMAQGTSAREAVEETIRSTVHGAYRQLAAVDRNGTGFVHTGERALGISAGCAAQDVACGGNLLSGDDIPAVMVEAFQLSEGHLASRLIGAIRAARDAGGEQGPVHSAGLLVVRDVAWPIIDLRVDWSEECPIERLAALWTLYQPQVEDYVARALDPANAPGYGVPGDDGVRG
jgi:uncharacterized Ntn-hydrolase superfamily protein